MTLGIGVHNEELTKESPGISSKPGSIVYIFMTKKNQKPKNKNKAKKNSQKKTHCAMLHVLE